MESSRGPALVVLATMFYSLTNAFYKGLYNRHMSLVSVFLFRAVCTYFFNAGIAEASGAQPAKSVLLLQTPSWKMTLLALLRGFAAFGQAMLLNLSFDLALSVADAFVIKEALGMFATLLMARLVLGSDERLGAREFLGISAVLIGLVLIAQPPFLFPANEIVKAPVAATVPRWGGFLMLACAAVFQGAYVLLTRVLSKAGGENAVPPATLLSCYMVVSGGCSGIAMLTASQIGAAEHWAKITLPHGPVDFLLMFGVVLGGTAGQFALTIGMRTTTASKLALLAINELAFAYVLSVTVLGEPTSVLSGIGTATVFLGSGLVVAGEEFSRPGPIPSAGLAVPLPQKDEDADVEVPKASSSVSILRADSAHGADGVAKWSSEQ